MTDYASRKSTNALTQRCVRSGCTNQSTDSSLLCEPCGLAHREANRNHMHGRRRQLRLPLQSFVHNSNSESGSGRHGRGR